MKDFNGYRLIIVDCKEEKIVVDELVTALVGGYVTIVDRERGVCGSKCIGLTRATPLGVQAAVDAAEESCRNVKERVLDNLKPGTLEKIKKMAAELTAKMFEGEDEE
jgi:hypothetical protein